jgi:hypothetical protein
LLLFNTNDFQDFFALGAKGIKMSLLLLGTTRKDIQSLVMFLQHPTHRFCQFSPIQQYESC